MNKTFKLGSIAAALILGGMLVGCGSSSNDGNGSDGNGSVTPPTPTPTNMNCTAATPAAITFGSDFNVSSIAVTYDSNKSAVTGVAYNPNTVDTSTAGTTDINITSENCENSPLTVTVTVNPEDTNPDPEPTDCSYLPGASNPCK